MESEEESGGGGLDKRKVLRQRSVDKGKQEKLQKKTLVNNLTKLLKKTGDDLTESDREFLESNDELVETIRGKMSDKETKEDRKKEWEDDLDVLRAKCIKLAEAIKKSKRLVVYTGAGISTSANIPDYRGPQGVWTLLDKGQEVAACDLGLAQPTTAHMALFMLYRQGKISHIVSQNCDGLHLRSGIPRSKLSEVHGNMFIEVCKLCKPVRPYVRLFDVTERTNRYRHGTRRRCYICGSGLVDTIVHFGERGSIAWPINWNGASRAAEKADMILCLGSSLKVLRRYPWLWCMDRPAKQRPPLYIVNLQWTPKDAAATLKLNGRCDFVMAEVVKHLMMKLPEYTSYNDPLLSYATHLHEKEEHTTSRKTLIESRPAGHTHLSMEANVSPTGVITEVRVSDKFMSAKSEFSYMSGMSTDRDPNSVYTASSERKASSSQPTLASSPSCSTSAHEDSSSPSDPCDSDYDPGRHHDDTRPSSPNVNQNDHRQNGHRSKARSAHQKDCTSDSETQGRRKKPKIESHSNSDCDSASDFEDEQVNGLLSNGGFASPFPSPDHNYAISPIKIDPSESKAETEEEEVKQEPKDDETPNSRYKLRQQKKCRYNELDEEYFLMCQEELLKSAKRDQKKHVENKIKEEIKPDEEFKELEYRTIEWDKDALYFSYEPSFLFVDEDNEDGGGGEEEFVCECCDPKKKKKVWSEDVSEEENEETDGLLSDSEDEVEDSPCQSREDSPTIGASRLSEKAGNATKNGNVGNNGGSNGDLSSRPTVNGESPTKPLAPGWFGKGRRRRGKLK